MNEQAVRAVFSFESLGGKTFGKLHEWAETFFYMLPNLVVAVLILVFCSFLAQFARRVLGRTLVRFRMDELLAGLLGNLLWLAFFIGGVLSALGVLHLDKAVTSILAGAGILGLAVSFAFQDIVSNFISGMLITFYKPFRVGQQIKSKEFSGVVETINLRTTILKNPEGERLLLPNKDIMQNPLINYSSDGKRRLRLIVEAQAEADVASTREKLTRLPFPKAANVMGPPEVSLLKVTDGRCQWAYSVWLGARSGSDFERERSTLLLAVLPLFTNSGLTVKSSEG